MCLLNKEVGVLKYIEKKSRIERKKAGKNW